MTYDTYGNIISKNGKTYSYDSVWHDLLTGIESESIEYDAQGNPTKYLGHTLTWEKGRQLKSYDTNTYTYNANGIRTSKTVNGVKHEYTLDGTKILKETWGGNTLIPLYDNEDSVCGIIYNDYAYYFLKNLQGDVIAITNNKGNVVASYSYDAWGVCTIVSDNTGIIARVNPFRYRGYYYDQCIGLYYLQSRYYDPNVGRFINGDEPIFVVQKETICNKNLFTYCYNSSTFKSDSFGFSIISIPLIMAIVKVAVSIFVLAYMIWLVTSILQHKSFQNSIKNAIKSVNNANKKQFEQVVVALIAAYALAHIKPQNPKFEVHHIVAQKAPRAVYARIILKAVNIDVNSSINTVKIKYNLHRRLHTNVYYDSVNVAVVSAYGSANTFFRRKIAVMSVLAGIKTILLGLSSAIS